MKLARVILVIAGVTALICEGVSYTTHRKAIDVVSPGQVERTHHYQRQLPQLLEFVLVPSGSRVLVFKESR
jgi:hypothetical protein